MAGLAVRRMAVRYQNGLPRVGKLTQLGLGSGVWLMCGCVTGWMAVDFQVLMGLWWEHSALATPICAQLPVLAVSFRQGELESHGLL